MAFETKYFNGIKIDKRNISRPFAAAIESFIDYSMNERGLSCHTIKHYRYSISLLMKYFNENSVPLRIESLTSSNLAGLFNVLCPINDKISFINRIYYNLKSLSDYLFIHGHIKRNPYDMLSGPKRNQADLSIKISAVPKKIFKSIKRMKYSNKASYYRSKVILLLLKYTGLRAYEILGLKVSSINFKDETIKITCSKSKTDRIIPLNRVTIAVIKHYLATKRHKPDDHLILNYLDNTPLNYEGLYRIIRNTKIKAGINKNISSRTFRRAFASKIINKGGDLNVLKIILGHQEYNVTSRYVYVPICRLRKSINLNPLIMKCEVLFKKHKIY